MADFIETLKFKYRSGDMMTRLIFINVAIFIILKITSVLFTLFNLQGVDFITFLGMPSRLSLFTKRIWTALTYMFIHEGFLHLLFNMLWLYWFGKLFLSSFSGRTLGSLYVLGGLAGAGLYLLAFNTIPYYRAMDRSLMIGASAAVMAIVMGIAFYRPELRLNLLFIGQIRLVYIALFAFLLDFLSLSDPTNPGGHVAHIGGALLGYLFAVRYHKGKDITLWMSRMIDGLFGLFKPRKKRSKMKVKHARNETDWEYNRRKHSEQQEIDAILDKLKQTGYSGLSSEEKKKLFDASKK